jgi:Icc-related predicted phosphoesterase
MESTILQFSDLHIQGENDIGRLEVIAGYASKTEPGALVLAGDIIDGFALAVKACSGLSQEEQMFLGLPAAIKNTAADNPEKKKLAEAHKKLAEKYNIKEIYQKMRDLEKQAFSDKKLPGIVDSKLEEIVKNGIRVLGVHGNHDPALKLYKNIQWIDEEGVDINGIRYEGTTNIYGGDAESGAKGAHVANFAQELFPHLSLRQGKRDYERIKAGWKDYDKRILVAHYAFYGPKQGHINQHFPEIEKLVSEEPPLAIFSGHTHRDVMLGLNNEQKTPIFVSSHTVGYRHVVDEQGVKESYKLWLVEKAIYEKQKKELDGSYNIISA